MVTLVGSAIVLCAICGAVEADEPALTLVRDGEATSIIVTAAAPSTAARQGAEDLNYYVLAKLLWNPHADVDAIVDQYCIAGAIRRVER